LAEHGYDPVYGARPLRRLIQREVEDRLANLLLAGAVVDGSFVTVEVAQSQETLELKVQE
jgi:ATP-dependent Clp protease ATP-binding subunit ClpB